MWTMCWRWRRGRATVSHFALNRTNLVDSETAFLAHSAFVELVFTVNEVFLHLLVHPYYEWITAILVMLVTDFAVLMYNHRIRSFGCIILVNIKVWLSECCCCAEDHHSDYHHAFECCLHILFCIKESCDSLDIYYFEGKGTCFFSWTKGENYN